MGLSFDQVLSQLRAIGDGAQVEMTLVSNQDDQVVSYARGFLVYHVHHFVVEEGLSRTAESFVGDSLQYLFNVSIDAIFVNPDAGGLGGESLLQPFSVKAAEQLQVSFRSAPEIATNPVTIELTLLSEGNDAFSVNLTPLGNVLHGVGRHVGSLQAIDDFVAEAVYLLSFGKPSHLQNKHIKEEKHTMGLTVCPAAVVVAPVEVVWENLVHWERYSEWFSADLQVERSEPAGPATVGQTINFAGEMVGLTLHFIFKVEEVNPERHQFGLHAFFPLGLQMKPHISCTPIDATTCRVQYG